MRDKGKAIKWFMVIMFLPTWFQPTRAFGVDLVFGFHYGYSFSLTEKQYNRWTDMPEAYSTPDMKDVMDFSLAVFYKNLGFTLNLIQQAIHEVRHGFRWHVHHWNFVYIGPGVEYRFFPDKNRNLNSYVSVVMFFLLYGGQHPEYPKTTDLRFSGGLRIKAISSFLFINTKISYFPLNSILSFMAGVELIL